MRVRGSFNFPNDATVMIMCFFMMLLRRCLLEHRRRRPHNIDPGSDAPQLKTQPFLLLVTTLWSKARDSLGRYTKAIFFSHRHHHSSIKRRSQAYVLSKRVRSANREFSDHYQTPTPMWHLPHQSRDLLSHHHRRQSPLSKLTPKYLIPVHQKKSFHSHVELSNWYVKHCIGYSPLV